MSVSLARGRALSWLSAAIGVIVAGLVVVSPARGLTNTTGTVNINEFVGADTFYQAGYDGSGVGVGNIEAGHAWTGHETLNHINPLHRINGGFVNGQDDRHATWTGFILGGRPTDPNQPDESQRGIAYGAELWTGAIAANWNPNGTNYSTSFSINNTTAVEWPYQIMAETGLLGEKVDVINSSWGQLDINGSGIMTKLVDAVVSRSNVTIVAAVGNNFSDPNGVLGPAVGQNVLAVGAVSDGLDPGPYYDQVPSFSSRGPSRFWIPDDREGLTGTRVPGGQSSVDLVAPARRLLLAGYDGKTGGAAWETTPATLAPDLYHSNRVGTSFASPVVAGGAALIVDVGKDRSAQYGGLEAIDSRVVKSVLMNSADKLVNWDNGQTLVGNVISTDQSLDHEQGTGRVNLAQAFDQYTAGTTNLPTLGGGDVMDIGWDFGQVGSGAPTDYLFIDELEGGSMLTATLDWLSDRDHDYDLHRSFFDSFDDLNLEIWQTDDVGTPLSLIAESVSLYNNTEHLHIAVPQTDYYGIRVVWDSEVYDFVGDVDVEQYGLAWSATFAQDATDVPGPAALLMGIGGMGWIAGRRGRRA